MIAALVGFGIGLAFGITAAWIWQAGQDAAALGRHLEVLRHDPQPGVQLEQVRIVYRGPSVPDWVNRGNE